MELTNSFVVPTDLETAWSTLLDVEAVAPAMPGATLTGRQGDEFSGTVKVKLGPISMVYSGTATFVEKDSEHHRVVIDAAGKETRGSSTARAHVVAELSEAGPDRTQADVRTDLAITGRPAQFGRGVIQDVAGRIIDQFAANLAARMTAAEPAVAERSSSQAAVAEPAEEVTTAEPAGPEPAIGPAERIAFEPRPPDDDAIDLFGTAGAPVGKRLAPVAGVVVLLIAVWWLVGRRRKRRT
jgi:uncharacterized protein